MRLIDADAIEFEYGGLMQIPHYDGRGIAEYFAEQIKQMPTIEPKKGKWIDECTCSICYWTHEDSNGFALLTHYSFCPNCGTKMEVE